MVRMVDGETRSGQHSWKPKKSLQQSFLVFNSKNKKNKVTPKIRRCFSKHLNTIQILGEAFEQPRGLVHGRRTPGQWGRQGQDLPMLENMVVMLRLSKMFLAIL